MAANLFSLVLASATGWALLALGYLPVGQLRKHGNEMLKAVGAWIVIAATAPPAVFHWYLIFALICLVAWTKLDRPAGKIWIAAAAALSLTLGLIFPLEISPNLLERENIFALASLYLGGGVAGLAYALGMVCRHAPEKAWRPPGFAQGWVALACVWMVILGLIFWRSVQHPGDAPSEKISYGIAAFVLGSTLLLIALGRLAIGAVRRDRLQQARLLAYATALFALIDSLVIQLFFL